MAEFASKGVAGAGLGTGIAGLALGVLNSSNNGNGLLGGLLGGGNQNVVSALQAENSMLKAENYSDKNAKEVYAQPLADNRRLRDEAFAYLKPLADESANNRVELAKLQAELKCCCEKQELREQIVLGKVNELALTTQADTLIGKYLPMLKQVGIVDENNKVDIEVAKGFINSAFDKSGSVEYLGFKFDKSDGEALINIMEKYKDD